MSIWQPFQFQGLVIIEDSGNPSLLRYPAPLPSIYSSSASEQLTNRSTELIDGDSIRSVWWRRPRQPLAPGYASPALDTFSVRNMRDLLWSYFSFLSNDILIVNEPFADAVADHKLLQLRTAKKCGLRIPTSLFTNDPSQVKAFVHRMRACGSKVVYKQLSPGSSVITHFTRVLTKEDEDRLEDIQGSPVILQEKIEGGVDVRVNIIGEAIYAMAHSPEEPGLVDIRSASRTQCARVTIPAQVELALRDFHNQCRIQFGAYDFIIDAAGNWYFLELNPGGQWLFVETAVSFPIAEAFAHLLWYGKVDVNKLKGNAYADNDLDHLLGPFLKGVMERALKTRPNQIIQPAGETC